jgi:glutathione-specific gamma-glutamylcyclotransferase
VDLWIFAYGSLMWRPNFVFEEAHPALLEGAHRSLCVYSVVHRGVHTAPGLVLGLDKGGRCQGMVFRVAAPRAQETRLYLHRRENVTNTYAAAMKSVRLLGGGHGTVQALCFLANRNHRQYAGPLSLERQAGLVRRSVGASGANIDYVINTVEHLRALGVHDNSLETLMTRLGHGRVKDRMRNGASLRREGAVLAGS